MSKRPRQISDDTAREITAFLLDKGIPQKEIASVVKRSQPWISGVKRERNLITFAQERGRQEAKDEIIKRVEDKTAQNLSKHLFQGTNVPKIEADTK